ncbi:MULTISPECIES: c-type cytochrome [Rhodomicrobium]|uniref:c-type cytochrome n=1 Tax=Rhodomicrobium TaxID=1068 RepID=UPI000B4BD82B|nr:MULTISPECIES: c-type cytochrome [Rhodomicrobium]
MRIAAAAAFLLFTPGAALAQGLFAERLPACIACHGENGVSPTEETPSLGGIPEYYALLQLVEFRDGNRKSDIMREIVKGMSDDDLRAAAAFVAQQPRPPAPEAGDPDKMQRGAAIAAKNRCVQCHGPQLLGGDQMPPLRHQREDYLLKALSDYKAERRLGERAAMVEIVAPLGGEDLAALAHYLAHLAD